MEGKYGFPGADTDHFCHGGQLMRLARKKGNGVHGNGQGDHLVYIIHNHYYYFMAALRFIDQHPAGPVQIFQELY